jgi:hypothetical protein
LALLRTAIYAWIGHKREDVTSYAVLFWPIGAYLIIYRAGRWYDLRYGGFRMTLIELPVEQERRRLRWRSACVTQPK